MLRRGGRSGGVSEAIAWDQFCLIGSAQTTTDGVEVRVTTRMSYNDAGDEKLYAFHRTFTFDSRGMLATISGETRVEVDTPGACP